MLREPVVIYVFSGSGNTHAVAGRVTGTLLDEGIAAQLRPLERSDPGDTLFAGTVGLAFPVALLSTYPFVWEFAENLADGRGRGIFMIDTLSGLSGGIVGPMRRVVSARGYRPVGAVEIRMPSNYARTERGTPGTTPCAAGVSKRRPSLRKTWRRGGPPGVPSPCCRSS